MQPMNLETYRKRQNWSLEDVARFVGLSNASAVWKHETGRTMPRAETIERYHKLTGGAVTAQDFVDAVNARKSAATKRAA